MLCVLHRFYDRRMTYNEKTYENLLKGLIIFFITAIIVK